MRLLLTPSFWAGACLILAIYVAAGHEWFTAAILFAAGTLNVWIFYLKHEVAE